MDHDDEGRAWRFGEARFEERPGSAAAAPDAPPVYRSVGQAAGGFFGMLPVLCSADARGSAFRAYEPWTGAHPRNDDSKFSAGKTDDALSEASLFLPPQPACTFGLMPLAKRPLLSAPLAAQPHEILSADAFDMVLSWLTPHPDLFATMRVCRGFRRASEANYARRVLRVPALPDALLAAATAAAPGDTIHVAAGVHSLSRELTIDVPLRILGPSDAGCQGESTSESEQLSTSESEQLSPSESGQLTNGRAVIASHASAVTVRTRCAAQLADLTLCRLGEASGYPNAAILAEAAHLHLDSLRVTSGGSSVESALGNFEATTRLPSDGGEHGRDRSPWALDAEPMPPSSPPSVPRDRPQSGLWVGAAASVELRKSVISCTHGPAIKVNRGRVDAEGCDIAFSRLGANIVANGGSVRLANSQLRSACGEGCSAWNNARILLQHNRICDNEGNGLAINSAGPRSAAIEIVGNTITGNRRSGVMFGASARSAVLEANTFARNGGGNVAGARYTEQGRSCYGRLATQMPRPPPLVKVPS